MLKKPNKTLKQLNEIVENKIVETTQYAETKNAIDSMTHFAGVKSIGMMILGETGLGKSTVLDKFVTNNLDSITESVLASVDYDFTPIPIIKFKMPVKPTVISVCEMILSEADHLDLTGTASALTRRVDKLFKNQMVQYLIIDECQHLLREHAGTTTTTVLNFIKNLMNEHKIIVIVAGIPTAEKALTKYKELEERLSYKKCYITEFEINSVSGEENFGSFLIGFDQLFISNDLNICTLYDGDMFDRIFLACAGSPRIFKYLIFKVLELGQKLDFENKITKQMFAKAYTNEALNKDIGNFNPFSAKFEKVKVKLKEWDNIKLETHKALLKNNSKKHGK